ncbi:MAG: hypothetical protein JKY56_01610, partial [Kofleriaceae bacterium]|nr:hypothetical protein [Kofleriaceae bacterium]
MKTLNILMNTAIIAVSLLAFEAVSEARRDYSACTDLPAADKTACNAAAHAKCDGLSGYWPQERCAQAIAPNFNICEKDGTYEKACQASNRARVICQSMELDMYKPESILEFKRRVLALPEVIQKEERFAANWGSCFGKTKCYASAKQLGHCKSAGDAYRKSFATVVDFYLGSGLEQQLKHVNTFMASGDFHAAKSSADQVLEKLAVLQEISNDVSFVRHRSANISAAITKLKLRKVDVDKAYQKTLAKVRCPAGRNNNRKVLK